MKLIHLAISLHGAVEIGDAHAHASRTFAANACEHAALDISKQQIMFLKHLQDTISQVIGRQSIQDQDFSMEIEPQDIARRA